jgi:hypothetical protein
MIEAGGTSTEEVAMLSEVCAPHQGCHSRTTRGPAQRRGGRRRAKAALPSKRRYAEEGK